ncbi:hypothetical protein NXY14_16190 [Bacteroides fragilis]|nr:hypothetical protein [Bacteroides fragilis]
MSLKIKNQLGIFDLQNDFSIEIEDTSLFTTNVAHNPYRPRFLPPETTFH